MALPATYSGEAVECSVFLLQLSLFIEMQPRNLVSEWSKVAFLISLLSGRVLLCAQAIWNSPSSLVNSFDAFAHFKEIFGLSTGSLSMADQLLHLRQGTSSVSDYTLQFRIPGSLLWMERDGADNCLPPRFRSPDQNPNADLWWQCRPGELNPKGCKDFPTTHCLSTWWNHSFSSLTCCLSSSTRTYAGGHQPTHSHGTCATSCHGSVSLLRCLGALYPKVSFTSPMPSGEYPLYRTWNLTITFDDSPTTRHS